LNNLNQGLNRFIIPSNVSAIANVNILTFTDIDVIFTNLNQVLTKCLPQSLLQAAISALVVFPAAMRSKMAANW
jgi:hypothetical protein